jgi:hypothetical protein
MTEYNNITLDVDELGIWLVDETEGGNFQQMGFISWKEIARGVQNALLQEKMLLILQEMGEEFEDESLALPTDETP